MELLMKIKYQGARIKKAFTFKRKECTNEDSTINDISTKKPKLIQNQFRITNQGTILLEDGKKLWKNKSIIKVKK